jgi:hypothetical protein
MGAFQGFQKIKNPSVAELAGFSAKYPIGSPTK